MEYPLPNLLELQRQSYEWFLQEGLRELLHSFSPIEDFTQTMSLEFLDFSLGEPKYPEEECLDRDVTYEAPLRVKVRLVNKKTVEMKEAEVYMGELPLMTSKGTFIINGAERVVVSQLVRSPGVYFRDTVDISGATLYSAQLIPYDGGWTEFDIGANNVLSVRIGQTRKFPVTALLRALSAIEEADPLPRRQRPISSRRKKDLVGKVLATMVLDTQTGELLAEAGTLIDDEVAERILRAAAPSEIVVWEERRRCLTNEEILLTFGQEEVLHHPKPEELRGKYLLTAIYQPGMAGPLAAPFQKLTSAQAEQVAALGLEEVRVLKVDPVIERTLEQDPSSHASSPEEIQTRALEIFFRAQRPNDQPSRENARSLLRATYFDNRRYDLARVGRYKINRKLAAEFEQMGVQIPETVRTLTIYDVIAIVRYLLALRQGQGVVDDIDHLENKRVRSVGELLLEQMRLGMLRLERVAKERMTQLSPEEMRPQDILSVKPIAAAVRSFFASGQLSQFMDQTNPLSELAHKRRLSAMGPGGLTRRSAKLEVRDVHRSHYGRICPIMTPEGPNIGLINSLTAYARINEYGFIETPYRRVVNGRVTDEIVYLDASEEAKYNIAPPNLPLGPDGLILQEEVHCRRGSQFPWVPREKVDFMDVSPMQVFSETTCLIPYLENDDANRALMGSNMQRQAVPLVRTEAPYVKTGIEGKIARDSGALLLAEGPGVVTYVDASRIVVRTPEGKEQVYTLQTFQRTNQSTCFHQKPLVQVGEMVKEGDVLADGPSTSFGELALGRNVTVAFMSWEGYNFEDAVVISERLVRDDVFTSVHIEKYEIQARDTKLGAEEITADIPNVGEEALRNLDERGIVRIGAEVKTGDILVGKVAPKGQAELSAEEKLVVAIFGKKAEEMRDSSLRMPHGAKGKVLAVRVLSRYKYRCLQCGHFIEMGKADMFGCPRCGGDLKRLPGDELPPGVNQLVRVYVAERRKIMVGDKMAGRHGNKGVVAKIVPLEDMPYLADGTPVDIILNPLGVPSRMNIGQTLETHLGEVARHWNITFVSPIFQSIPERQIMEWLEQVVQERIHQALRIYLLTELPIWHATPMERLARWREWMLLDEEALEALAEKYPRIPRPLWERAGKQAKVELLLKAWEAENGPPPELWDEEETPIEALVDLVRQRLLGLDEASLERLGEHLAIPLEAWEPASHEERVDLILQAVQENVKKRVGYNPKTAKAVLYDGRTGEPFEQEVCVGSIFMMKLHHLVEDKIHARSTGPYSLVTQQPLGGKAQFGGQRFGEMEVWALEAYGAAYTLQEILTVKSDDVTGRVKSYEAIVKGVNTIEPGIPESFKILIKELQGLGLKVNVETQEGQVVDLRESEEEEERGRLLSPRGKGTPS